MSGGHFDYFYIKVEDMAGWETDPEIADLMSDLAKLLHDEEWWLSADYGREDWEKSLRWFKTKWFKQSRNERLKSYIDNRVAALRSELYALIGENVKDSCLDKAEEGSAK